MQEGVERGRREVAAALRATGMSRDEVLRVTGVDLGEES